MGQNVSMHVALCEIKPCKVETNSGTGCQFALVECAIHCNLTTTSPRIAYIVRAERYLQERTAKQGVKPCHFSLILSLKMPVQLV